MKILSVQSDVRRNNETILIEQTITELYPARRRLGDVAAADHWGKVNRACRTVCWVANSCSASDLLVVRAL